MVSRRVIFPEKVVIFLLFIQKQVIFKNEQNMTMILLKFIKKISAKAVK